RDILKRQEIPCRIVSVVSIAQGEFDENMMRKDFAPSEQVAIIDTLRGYAHGGDRKSDQGRNCDLDRLTTKEAAGRVGFCLDNGLHDRSTMRLALAPHHTIPPRRPLPSVVSRSIAAMPSLISPGPGPRSRESGSTTVRDT